MSAPPAYWNVPQLVLIVELLVRLLFLLSTISSKIREMVTLSPGRHFPPAMGANAKSWGSLVSSSLMK